MAIPPKKTTDLLRTAKRPDSPQGNFEILSSDGAWDYFGMMLYGAPGVGKTWLACTSNQVAQLRPVILIDNDGGSKTIRGKSQFNGIDIIRVHKFEAYNDIYELLLHNKKGYKTVIIDNVGAMHTMAMALEMERVCAEDVSREAYVPSKREYGIVRGMIHKLIRFYEALPMNLIVTAHHELDKDEVTNRTYIRPAVSGKLSYEIPGFLDINAYLTVERIPPNERKKGEEETRRVLQFQPDGRVDAKDESSALGAQMYNPTMAEITKLIKLGTK